MTDKEAKKLLEKLKKNERTVVPHYCIKCGVIHGDVVKREINETYNVKGDMKLTIKGLAAYCPNCGSRISDECDNERDLAAYREYRKIKGFLQPEEILAVREKYNLSARKFAALLNLGDHVIYELERGAVGTASVDATIRSVMTFAMLKKYLSNKKTKLPQKDVDKLLLLCNYQADICNEKITCEQVTIARFAPCYA